jgi:hypothetical protein
MKLIFLDIDGVMNNELFYTTKHQHIRHKEAKEDAPEGSWDIDERCVILLNHIINKTKAKVVISSSWRSSYSIEEFQTIFEYLGFRGEIISKTPHLVFRSSVEYNYSVPRGCEIKAWLELNKNILGDKMSKTKYVILDDDSDMLYWQRNNYFLVDGYTGLTPNLAYRVIKYLNNTDD